MFSMDKFMAILNTKGACDIMTVASHVEDARIYLQQSLKGIAPTPENLNSVVTDKICDSFNIKPRTTMDHVEESWCIILCQCGPQKEGSTPYIYPIFAFCHKRRLYSLIHNIFNNTYIFELLHIHWQDTDRDFFPLRDGILPSPAPQDFINVNKE